MLKLILGRDWTANTKTLLQRVAADVKSGLGGRILLVPELISHDMERRLCETAGDTASRFAEVLTFTRLGRRVAEYAGCGMQECLDKGGRVVVMSAAARQLHGKLKVYAALEAKSEFLEQLLDAVDEFKRCRITPEDLLSASKRADGVLAQKLEELSLLLEAYDALCQRGKRDPRDQMNWVLEQLEDGDFAEEHIFYVDGFPDFTRQHMAILEYLIVHSKEMTVSLNCDNPTGKGFAFEKAAETASQLIKFAHKSGIEVEIISVDPLPTPLQSVRDYLFQGPIPFLPELASRIRLYRADSVYQECLNAAREILALVQNGCRYRDISVVCTDPQNYSNIIGMVFRRHKIPIYLSGTEDIISKGPITTIINAIEAVLEGFDQSAMIRYLRSAASPIDAKTCDLVENYVYIWGISEKRWLEPWTCHPDGLSDRWTDWTRKRLELLEQTRISVIEPLVRLRNDLKAAGKLSDQVMSVYRFLEDINFAKRLAAMAMSLDRSGDNRSAQILNQLWEILISALEQMHDDLGETYWDLESFQRLFVLLLSQYDVGTIPTVLDAVTVGPVTAMRCQQAKHLFVLGAAEGLLPAYGGSKGVLTDQERVALRKLDVQLTGGALEGIQAEFAEVYGVFCGAKETISVSYSSTQPSYLYRRLKEMVGHEEELQALPGFAVNDPRDAAAYLYGNGSRDIASELGLLDEYCRLGSKLDHRLGKVNSEQIRKLYGDKLTLSASQVDRQAECRFSYFMRYGIRAQERKEATVDPAEFGTYVHWVLENTAREVVNRGGFHHVSLEETMDIASRFSKIYADEHFGQLGSQRAEYLFQRNVRELDLVVEELWTELSAGSFLPVDFELGFGPDEKMPGIQIRTPDMDAELLGYVDRVDAYKIGEVNYFRVVDYKTGRKDFDYCDVFNGVGLQMLLYLFALEQGGAEVVGTSPIPAGVQYFPARVPFVSVDGVQDDETSERRKLWCRKGLLLLDELSLIAMDPDEDMKRLSCTRRKDGTLSGDLATREQLKHLRKYIFGVLEHMVQEIASGIVEPNPYTRGSSHDACAFCPYGTICHKDHVEGRRNYKAMKPQQFWERVEKEVSAHG